MVGELFLLCRRVTDNRIRLLDILYIASLVRSGDVLCFWATPLPLTVGLYSRRQIQEMITGRNGSGRTRLSARVKRMAGRPHAPGAPLYLKHGGLKLWSRAHHNTVPH